MKRTQILVTALSAAMFGIVAGPAMGQAAGGAQTRSALPGSGQAQVKDAEDAEFLTGAIRSNITEIRMGELANQKSTNPQVKQYGTKLKTDHSKTLQEITVFAETTGLTIPTEPDAEQQASLKMLSTLAGAQFDGQFIEHMVMAHTEAVEKYSAQTHANPNKALSDLASKTLPTLREHLEIAKSLQAQGGGHDAQHTQGTSRDNATSPGSARDGTTTDGARNNQAILESNDKLPGR